MQTNEQYYVKAANQCAHFIFNNDSIRKEFNKYISLGKNPQDHVYYYAAYILGKDEELDIDIEEYEAKKNEDFQK